MDYHRTPRVAKDGTSNQRPPCKFIGTLYIFIFMVRILLTICSFSGSLLAFLGILAHDILVRGVIGTLLAFCLGVWRLVDTPLKNCLSIFKYRMSLIVVFNR